MDRGQLPLLYRVIQPLNQEEIPDPGAELIVALNKANAANRVRKGMRIAVTVGSRGIDRIDELVRELVSWLKSKGARPFVLAAMGSHGGGTAKGRLEVLKSLGITLNNVGAPVLPGSQPVVLGKVHGLPVYSAKEAVSADGIVVMNRVKPHTSYHGAYESGPSKMMAVGMGLTPGASAFHSRGVRELAGLAPALARVVLAKTPVLFGIALIENGMDRLKRIEVIPKSKILSREPALLDEARKLRPGLPFSEADVLVVDYFGKDLSGAGMDTNVIGRLFIAGEPEPDKPRIKRIAALRLSVGANGNAYGIGLSDVTTRAAVEAMDDQITMTNVMASGFIERARVPICFDSDCQAISAAIKTSGVQDPARIRLCRIRDTLHLEEVLVSKPLLKELKPRMKVVAGPLKWRFNRRGNLEL